MRIEVLTTHPSLTPSTYPYIYLSTYLSTYLSECVSDYLYICHCTIYHQSTYVSISSTLRNHLSLYFVSNILKIRSECFCGAVVSVCRCASQSNVLSSALSCSFFTLYITSSRAQLCPCLMISSQTYVHPSEHIKYVLL